MSFLRLTASTLALGIFAASAASAASAQQAQPIFDLPPEISLTNAMDPAMRRAIEAGDAAQVIALGGAPRQVLASALRTERPQLFEELAAKLGASPHGRLELITHEGRAGLALVENGRVVHAVIPASTVLGPPPARATPLTDTTGLRAGARTLLTLSGRRLGDDPAAVAAQPALAAGGGLAATGYGVQSINLQNNVLTSDPCPEGQRLVPATAPGRLAFCSAG